MKFSKNADESSYFRISGLVDCNSDIKKRKFKMVDETEKN